MSLAARIPRGEKAVRRSAAAIVLAGLLAYADSLGGSALFDDRQGILENPSLRHWWRLGEVLTPSLGGGVTVNGRPVLNLSLALNYAVSGSDLWSYHALNLAIHLAAGLALFGLARRTLRRRGAGDDPAAGVAFAAALWWTVHPLATEAVSYVIQRAESLMGLFYLLTLYGLARAADEEAEGRRPARWLGLSVLACLLGMGTKEVMATAPVLALLYDRTFLAGTFAAAWARRRRYYALLAATWVPLAALVAGTGGNRGGTVGFGVGVRWWAYALTQFEAVGRYLLLSVWPHPLVFEYGTFWVKGAAQVLPWAIPVALLLAAAAVALRRRPALGFLGAWFFVILSPSSLMPGTIQMIVEHRAYLPLAAVTALAAWGLDRMAARRGLSGGARLAGALAVALVLGVLTFHRNAPTATAWRSGPTPRPKRRRTPSRSIISAMSSTSAGGCPRRWST